MRPLSTLDEAKALQQWVEIRDVEYGQALRFILSSGARIDETLHLRADKIFVDRKCVELQGKGGGMRQIPVLHAEVLRELDRSRRFAYLTGNDSQMPMCHIDTFSADLSPFSVSGA